MSSETQTTKKSTATAPQNPYDRFSATAIAFHWIVGILILVVIGLSYYMESLPMGTYKFQMYNLHKSLGLLVLLFAIPRILYRLTHGRPPKFDHYAKWEVLLSSLVTWLLYGLLFAMPISGLVMNLSGGHDLKWFNIIAIPNFIGENHDLHEIGEEAHEIMGEALQILIILHVLGTLKHFVIDKDNTLFRMLPLGFFNNLLKKRKKNNAS
jgi:cytochrome b561